MRLITPQQITTLPRLAATAAMSAGQLTARFCVAAGSAIFDGHYPHHPLVPGMYLVEAALQVLEAAWSARQGRQAGALHCARLSDLRLIQAVGPDARIDLAAQPIDVADAPGGLHWQVSLSHAGLAVARFKLGMDGADRIAPRTLPVAPEIRPVGPAGTIDANWQRLSAVEVARRLAHRSPILLVDEAYVEPGGQALIAQKAVSLNEPCYARLAEPDPLGLAYPDVLVIESFVQASGLLIAAAPHADRHTDLSTGAPAAVMVLGGLRRAELIGRVWPGDVLRHELRVLRVISGAALVSGVVRVGPRPVAAIDEVLIALRSAEALGMRSPIEPHTAPKHATHATRAAPNQAIRPTPSRSETR